MKPLHQCLYLYIEDNDEAYTFVPTEPVGAQSLTIYRPSGDIVLNRHNAPIPSSARLYGRTIFGILGLISLSLSEYIILLTGREIRGRLNGHDVYRATDFEILPLNSNVSVHNPPHPVEGHLLALLRSHLREGFFLFSYELDLTRRLQAQWETQEKDQDRGYWEVADDRFFWNKFLQSRFIDAAANSKQDLDAYILPMTYGTFDIRPAIVHGRHLQLCLISRRSRFRAGTRYFRRGIDHEGHVANFNETEQLVFIEEASNPTSQQSLDEYATQFSFTQVRGSVPLFWAEINTLRYKPDLQIMDLQDTADVMRTHLQELASIYGEQVLVNLLNPTGHEQPVKEAFELYLSQSDLPTVRYQYFDFHSECKNMQWDRINGLIDNVEGDLMKQGYFHLDANQPVPVKLQQGTFRTNCMDNLDRTNVVQAAFAKWAMNQQLKSIGLLPQNASIDDYEELSRNFREIWADHADLIAKAYGGSGALKSDFTRSNKRTKKGVMEDGIKSSLRYLKNNYFDGARQDGFDLVTGAWVPRKNPSSATFLVTDNRPLITRSVPVVASFSLFMICAGLTLPRTSDYSLFYYFLLWFTLLSVSLIFICINGIDYVSWPRLIPPTDIIYYNGPGFRSAHHGKGFGMTADKNRFDPSKSMLWLSRGRRRAASRAGIEEIEMGTMLKKRVD